VSESSSSAGQGRRERDLGARPVDEEPELAEALDAFVEWVREEADPELVQGLPPLRLGDALEPGTVLGDYELVRRIGTGGMGAVFEARQRHVVGRRVALKVLRSAFETEELSRRFKREVAAVAGLDHPAIVPVMDARVDGGTPFYVMKFVEGVSAAGLIRELRSGARIPVASAPVRRFVERCARSGPSGEAGEPDAPPTTGSPGIAAGSSTESSSDELVSLANARAAELGIELPIPEGLPLRRAESGQWTPTDEVDPAWPVKGATPMDMFDWASWLEGRIPCLPADWVPSLPTRAEWVRAARGADGRPYPWGWEFDGSRCANYVWGPHYGRDADPVPIGSVPADVSPFLPRPSRWKTPRRRPLRRRVLRSRSAHWVRACPWKWCVSIRVAARRQPIPVRGPRGQGRGLEADG
jgi:hypothetical protein